MTRSDHSLTVTPQRQQFTGAPGATFDPTFSVDVPWYQGVALEITAGGQIWSGYVCTGLTPPGGWSEQDVSGNTDFSFHSVRAHPQCLIGTLDRGQNWFFIGTGKSIPVSTAAASLPPHGTLEPPPLPSGGPTSPGWPPPAIQLALAVNRTQPTVDVAGDHQWDVTVTVIEPDWIVDSSGMGGHWDSSQACALLSGQIGDEQGANAAAACEAVGAALRAVSDRWTLFNIASGIAGGAMVAAVTAAVAVAAVDATARAGAQQSTAGAIGGVIQAFAASPAVATGSLAWLISPVVSVDATTTTLNALWSTATAAASPLSQQLWTGIVIWGLVIIMAIAVVVAIGLLLSQLTLAADVDNSLSNWDALVAHVQSLLDALSALGCAPPPDLTLPSCPAVTGG